VLVKYLLLLNAIRHRSISIRIPSDQIELPARPARQRQIKYVVAGDALAAR